MIAVIKKGNNVRGIITYHETKVASGKAIRIEDTTLSDTKHERIKAFEKHALLNRRVRKDKYSHISISFPRSEQLSQDKKITIAERYLHLMGYENAPRIMYYHSDTDYDHFHVVTSTITFEGKKINTYRDHYKNQEVSRQIEQEFNLKITQYEKGSTQSLQELSASKYSISKALQNLQRKKPEVLMVLKSILTENEIETIVRDSPADPDIRTMLELRGITDDKIAELYEIFQLHNVLYKTDKQTLIEQLRSIKKQSSNMFEFQDQCRKQGIYVRVLTSDKGKTITYGLPEKKFYIRDKKLPHDLKSHSLFRADPEFDRDAQLIFLKRMITRHLKRSKSLEDFQQNLKTAGIESHLASNAGGIYGISFRSTSIRNGQLLKGSEVGLSWQSIKQALETKEKAQKLKTPKPIAYVPTEGLSKLSKHLDTSGDDEKDRQRKNKGNEL